MFNRIASLEENEIFLENNMTSLGIESVVYGRPK